VGGPQSSTKMFTRWVIHNLLKNLTFKINSTFNFQKEIIKNIMTTKIDIGLMGIYSNYHGHENYKSRN